MSGSAHEMLDGGNTVALKLAGEVEALREALREIAELADARTGNPYPLIAEMARAALAAAPVFGSVCPSREKTR